MRIVNRNAQSVRARLNTPNSADFWQSGALFSGPSHRLVLIGKDGGSLKPDIRLRDMDVPVAS
jgi:hypothetical protein